VNSRLEAWLDSQPASSVATTRRFLSFLLEAYTCSLDGLVNQPRLNVMGETGPHSFHFGTPVPDLRTIASWSITHCDNARLLIKVMKKLWKRHGKEDVVMFSFLVANTNPHIFNRGPWMFFLHVLGDSEAVDDILEVGEEMVRAGHPLPDNEWIEAMANQSRAWHQYAVLFLAVANDDRTMPVTLLHTAPRGGFMYEKIRIRLLEGNN